MLRIIAHINGLIYVVTASPKIALRTSRVTTVVNRHPIAGNIFWILMCLLEWSQRVLSSNIVCTISPVNIPAVAMYMEREAIIITNTSLQDNAVIKTIIHTEVDIHESMITRGARASPVTTVVAPIYDDGYITPVASEGFNNRAFWTPNNIWATSQVSTRHCKDEKLYARYLLTLIVHTVQNIQ